MGGAGIVTADGAEPGIKARDVQGEADFHLVRNLLIETYSITPPGFNWDIRRWDGSYFYNEKPGWEARWGGKVRLWETGEGRLVGAAHPESGGDGFLELHPDYRQIEEEMVAWAEAHLACAVKDGDRRQVSIYVYEYDAPRRRLLEKRGYEKMPSGGVIRRMRFGQRPLPQPSLAQGYALRTTRPDDEADCQRIADLLNAAFGRDWHTAMEYHSFASQAPCYRNELDLVAEAPGGSFGAYVGMTYDAANCCGFFEPVCTHPDHRRKGLAGALMREGLRRVKALGATDVYVDTGDRAAANEFYETIGFTEAYKGYDWRKPL
jgi:GNAT superfamily N-acetyltransferase